MQCWHAAKHARHRPPLVREYGYRAPTLKVEVRRSGVPVASPLRWAGGKRWLLRTIQGLVGSRKFPAYHEPFLGGASVFLGLGELPKSFLRDSNAELIATYRAIRDHPGQIAELVNGYSNDSETYYRIRASRPKDKIERAAQFLYLNHTSFNGIYRVNLDGVYNVPFGNRLSPQVPTAEHLRDVSKRLKSARLGNGDFAKCLRYVGRGDLVFLDPPYTVAHNHNGFVKYNQRLFSFDDQQRLSALIDEDPRTVGRSTSSPTPRTNRSRSFLTREMRAMKRSDATTSAERMRPGEARPSTYSQTLR